MFIGEFNNVCIVFVKKQDKLYFSPMDICKEYPVEIARPEMKPLIDKAKLALEGSKSCGNSSII